MYLHCLQLFQFKSTKKICIENSDNRKTAAAQTVVKKGEVQKRVGNINKYFCSLKIIAQNTCCELRGRYENDEGFLHTGGRAAMGGRALHNTLQVLFSSKQFGIKYLYKWQKIFCAWSDVNNRDRKTSVPLQVQELFLEAHSSVSQWDKKQLYITSHIYCKVYTEKKIKIHVFLTKLPLRLYPLWRLLWHTCSKKELFQVGN